MDIRSLERSVQSLFSSGLADSTKSSYSTAQKRYLSFCSQLNLSPLPLTEKTLCLQLRTISAYLSALRHLQISAGLQAPQTDSWPWLHYVTRGLKRSLGQANRTRLPITSSIMRQLQEIWSGPEAKFTDKLFWAIACTAFFGFFRLGELLPKSSGSAQPTLSLSDLSTDSHYSPSIFILNLKRSKTDPFGKGTKIYLRKSGNLLCPVQALVDFLLLRPNITGGLFIWENGSVVSKEQFISALRLTLVQVGLDSKLFAGHSFRIGAATSAASAGVPAHVIKHLGRWSSDAHLLYIRSDNDPQVTGIASILAESNSC